MICRNCGNQMQNGAKFCPRCGALNSPDTGGEPPQGAAAPPAWEKPVSGGKKKTGLIIAAAAAAAAIIALLAVAATGLFAPPKQKLERAIGKSLAAYVQAGEALDLPNPGGLERPASQRISLRLTGLDTAMAGYDLSALEGLGLRFQSDLDTTDRKMGMELAAFWDDRELLSVLLAADGAQVCFASPQLTGGDFYGVNTETLGEDLRRVGIQDAGDISFNLFDLLDIIAPEGHTEEIGQAVKEANKALFEAVQVEKGGSKTIPVNQAETKTDVYRVTIPKDAIKGYVNTVAGARYSMDYVKLYRELCRAMGVPEQALEKNLGELGSLDLYGGLGGLLDGLGDVKLAVYVGGGYVSAVTYEGYLSEGGTFLGLELYLGGGKEYVDNLRLVMDVDRQKITIDSSGDHSCKSGAFTDETTIRGPFSTAISELRYEPGNPQGNFSWEISIPGAGSLGMAGQFTGGDGSVELHLDELCLKVLGMELCSVEMDYYMGPCEGQGVAARNPRLIGEMDSLELALAALKLETGAQGWIEDMRELFISRLPPGLSRALMGAF